MPALQCRDLKCWELRHLPDNMDLILNQYKRDIYPRKKFFQFFNEFNKPIERIFPSTVDFSIAR